MIKQSDNGFTLIELIVVMAVIAVLVLLAAPRFLGYTKDAKVTSVIQDTKVLSDASELYRMKTGKWPFIEESTPRSLGIGGVDKVYPIDGNEIGDSIKSIEGGWEDYGIAIDGKYKGQVFHLSGVKDKTGDLHYSYGVSGNGYYTQFEIEGLMSKGYIPIATADDLDKVRENLDGNYIQVADIDLSNIESFEPIGVSGNPFTGVYDGGGFRVTRMTISELSGTGVGFFGVAKGAKISNLGMSNVNITGQSYVGGLVGFADNDSHIVNSYATGKISGKDGVGGLIGSVFDVIISNSYTNVEISSDNWNVGGLMGRASGSYISNSYSLGSVVGYGQVGGLIGHITDDTTVSDSFSTGSVMGNQASTGGLIGLVRYRSVINNSYTVSEIKASGKAFTGGHHGDTRVTNSYWNHEIANQQALSGAVGKSTSELQQQSTYKGWNFDTIWQFNEDDYPTLRP